MQDVDVAAGGVAGVDDAAVPGAVAFLEDVHVVAVVVEAVRERIRVLAGMSSGRRGLFLRDNETYGCEPVKAWL